MFFFFILRKVRSHVICITVKKSNSNNNHNAFHLLVGVKKVISFLSVPIELLMDYYKIKSKITHVN